MKKNILYLILSMICFSTLAQNYKGQSTVVILTNKEKEIFKERTLEKITDFQSYLSFIASKDNSYTDKAIYKEISLSLFIANGKTVEMEVSSKYNPSKFYKLPVYLEHLCNLSYAKVELKTAKSCYVSNWYKSGTDEYGNPIYEATATYYQEFIGYSGDKAIYRDITQKTVKVEIRYTTNSSKKDGVGKWIVLLGDISVLQTT